MMALVFFLSRTSAGSSFGVRERKGRCDSLLYGGSVWFMATLRDLSRRTLDNVRHGRHWEAYVLLVACVTVAILGLARVISLTVLVSVVLLAIGSLVFHSAAAASGERPVVDQVLRNREDFGAFSSLLPGVRDLRVYGPTAINVLVNAADIRRFVLAAGGTMRVIVQDDNPNLIAEAALQLDDNLDLESTLRSSLATLSKLAVEPGFSFRKLPVHTGFSLVVVDAEQRSGYVIFESHGFKDDNIADRMHIVIRRDESPQWFAYWVARFEAMWEAAGPVLSALPASSADTPRGLPPPPQL
jgi:hypothetical protein